MSGSSRVWVYQSSKLLVGDLADEISNQIDAFLVQWAAHGKKLFSGFELLYDRFIVIAVDESKAMATGCSIDSMMSMIQKIDQEHSLDLLNRMKVAYRHSGQVSECDVNTFTKLLKSGEVSEQTLVYNNILNTLSQLDSDWLVPVKDSWHANLLP